MQPAHQDSSQALAFLEKHKKRVEALQSRQTRIQVQLGTAREQYRQAVAQAKESFGTADVPELERLLSDKIKANNAAVAEFVKAVDEFEAHLSRIETALSDPVALEEFLQGLPVDEGSSEVGTESGLLAATLDDEDI